MLAQGETRRKPADILNAIALNKLDFSPPIGKIAL